MGQAVAATMHINLFISWKRGSGGRERGVYWPHVKQFKKAINTQKKKERKKKRLKNAENNKIKTAKLFNI